jgi:hypothetical protein
MYHIGESISDSRSVYSVAIGSQELRKFIESPGSILANVAIIGNSSHRLKRTQWISL